MFGLSDGIPTDHMYFPFGVNSASDEIPLDPIYKILNFPRQKDILHDMVGNAT